MAGKELICYHVIQISTIAFLLSVQETQNVLMAVLNFTES